MWVGEISYTAEVRRGGGEAEPVVGDARITEAEVDSAYQAWMKRAQKKLEELGSEDGALDSMRAWAARHPMTVSTTFDNEAGPDYSRIFEEAPVIDDTSRLTDYALHLRDLMAQKDTAQLVEEYRPKIRYAHDRVEQSGETFRGFLRSYRRTLIEEEPLGVSRENIRPRRWSSGRVWELRRRGEDDLFSGRKVYVAELDGELKVVR
jgi:hypothetical protein